MSKDVARIYLDIENSYAELSLDDLETLVNMALSREDRVFESLSKQIHNVKMLKNSDGYKA